MLPAQLPLSPDRVQEGGCLSYPRVVGEHAYRGRRHSGFRMTFSDNASIEFLDLPRLTGIAGNLAVTDNAILASVSMPVLNELGSGLSCGADPCLDEIFGNPNLTSCTGALIDAVGDCVQP